MNDESSSPPPDDNEKVGYGNPPRATRFKPGQSGNPRGRPKGSRSIGKMLQDALSRRVRVQENGKWRMLPFQLLIIRRLVTDSAKGDVRATKLLLVFIERFSGASETAIDMNALAAEDQMILRDYLAEQKKLDGSGADESSAKTDRPERGRRDDRAG